MLKLKLFVALWLIILSAITYAGQFEKVLFDFKDAKSIQYWQAKEGAQISWRSDGTMFFKTPKESNNATRWPGVSTEHFPADWSAYDELWIELYSYSDKCRNFPIIVRAAGKTHYFEKPAISSGHWTTVKYHIYRDKLNVKDIKSLTFYQSHPSFPYSFAIKKISLISNISKNLTKLAQQYSAIGDKQTATNISTLLKELQNGRIKANVAKKKYQTWLKNVRQATIITYLNKQFTTHFPKAPFVVVEATSSTRIMPFDLPIIAKVKKEFSVSLAKNEYEAIQAVVIAPKNRELKALTVKVSDLSLNGNSDIKLPASAITIAPVGYVKTERSKRRVTYKGWFPDPILEYMTAVDIKPGAVQSFWVRVKTSTQTTPGSYTGNITFATHDGSKVVIPLQVTVWNFIVPKRGHLKFATSVYLHRKLLTKEQFESFATFIMDRYRINPFSIYSRSAYGEPYLPKIGDYKKYLPLGLNFIPIVYLKLPRQAIHKCSPKESKAKWAQMTPAAQKHYPPKWREKLTGIVKKRSAELKKAGLWDISYCYGFDEASTTEWPACAELGQSIKAVVPDCKFVTTAGDSSYGTNSILGDFITDFVPTVESYNFKLAQQARKQGKKVWWYSITMDIDRDSLSDIRALTGTRSFANQVDGFLVWTVSRWSSNDKPITGGVFTDWNPESYPGYNGGGSYFCAGPNGTFLPTLRAEAIRDGLEDYEYLYMLRKLANQLPASSALKIKSLKLLKSINREHPTTSLQATRRQIALLIESIIKQQKNS